MAKLVASTKATSSTTIPIITITLTLNTTTIPTKQITETKSLCRPDRMVDGFLTTVVIVIVVTVALININTKILINTITTNPLSL